MLRSTSVVITTTSAVRLIDVSPVSSPTRAAPKSWRNSWYFWFERALRGVV